MKIPALACLIAALATPAIARHGGTGSARLVLTFEPGAETGAVMVSLFDSESAYAGGAPIRRARIDVARGDRATVFELPAGTYAVRAFHDVDGDGRLSVNPFGVPTEPFAFSNNARGNMGPAGWDQARIVVAGETAQTIAIR